MAIACISLFLTKVPPTSVLSIREQIATLKDKNCQCTVNIILIFNRSFNTICIFNTIFKRCYACGSELISVFYFIFGIAAVIGGGFEAGLRINVIEEKYYLHYYRICVCDLPIAINDILIPAVHYYDGTLEYAELGYFTSTTKLFN